MFIHYNFDFSCFSRYHLWISPLNLALYDFSSVGYVNNGFIAVGSCVATSKNGLEWQKVAYLSDTIYGLAYYNGKYVLVGNSGSVITSKDSTTWDNTKTEENIALRAVTFGSGKFVAVGDRGYITVSLDGEKWTSQSIEEGPTFNSIVYADGKFTACGALGSIYQSSDASHWSPVNSGTTSFLNSIIYSEGVYYIGGGSSTGSGQGALLKSRDGIHWESSVIYAQGSSISSTVNSLAIANDSFVACGNKGFLATSKDWINWRNSDKQTSSSTLYDTVYFKDRFFAAGKNGQNCQVNTLKFL